MGSLNYIYKEIS